MTTGDFFKDTVFARSNPAVLMLCVLFAGFFFGVSKDVFKISERLFGKNAVVIFTSDFVSFVMSYLFVFVCALHFNHGIVRFYHLLIFAVGVFFYKKTLSEFFVFILSKIFDIIERLIKLAVKIILFPAKKIFKESKGLFVRLQKHILLGIQKRKYNAKCVKYYKLALLGFGLLPDEKGENKNNDKKTRSSCDTFRNSSSDNFGVQASDGA